ncbi:MAG: alpha/beta fold hydrolase [Candidatus Heimdallarchaeota archaeon]|nr:alpha/beta fold hydrolase [Candidatus Heimdallarchaeota archaeon]
MSKCVITCHGFTGFSEEMNPLGEFLERHGYSWHNLVLPGHETTPEDLRQKKWIEWTDYVSDEVSKKLKEFDSVYFMGLSMGGLMTLWVLENFPNIKAGVTLSAPVKILKWYERLITILPIGWWVKRTDDDIRDINDPDQRKIHRAYLTFHTDSVKQLQKLVSNVRNNLNKITQPLLIVHSTQDKSIPVSNAEKIYISINSDLKEKYIVQQSGHVLTRDLDRDKIFSKILDFIAHKKG